MDPSKKLLMLLDDCKGLLGLLAAFALKVHRAYHFLGSGSLELALKFQAQRAEFISSK
jgi:hypothetical protein